MLGALRTRRALITRREWRALALWPFKDANAVPLIRKKPRTVGMCAVLPRWRSLRSLARAEPSRS